MIQNGRKGREEQHFINTPEQSAGVNPAGGAQILLAQGAWQENEPGDIRKRQIQGRYCNALQERAAHTEGRAHDTKEWEEQRFIDPPEQLAGMERQIQSTQTIPANRISREEMLRQCGVQETEYFTGVKLPEQENFGVITAEEMLLSPDPQVCSEEERMQTEEKKRSLLEFYRADQERQEEREDYFAGSLWKEGHQGADRQSFLEMGASGLKKGKKAYGTKEGTGTSNGSGSDKGEKSDDREKKKDKAKHVMLRNYVIKELVHEPGKTDPESHFQLIKQLIVHDLTKPIKALGWLILRKLLKLFLAILAVLLQIAAMLLPIIIVLYLLMQPSAFFAGVFDDDEIMENPQNIRNVVQEMYTGFYGNISTFQDEDDNNEVEYIYGQCDQSQAQEILAVYLACTTLADDYGRMDPNEDYPPYLLVDTENERALLTAIFEQFNYARTEEITVSGTNEDGTPWEAQAEKMSVYCLSAEQWKEEHLSELSDKEKELLESLLEQIQSTAGNASGSFGAGASVPIEELVIPEGVDENLVYMAGFIRAEAGNQPYQGKVAVAYVILNRAGGPSGNIKGVLTAPYQFSCYIPYHTVEQYLSAYASMTDEERAQDPCWQAAAAAYNGTAANPIGGMKYYCNPKYCSAGEAGQWSKIRARNSQSEILVIGDHVFCQNCW